MPAADDDDDDPPDAEPNAGRPAEGLRPAAAAGAAAAERGPPGLPESCAQLPGSSLGLPLGARLAEEGGALLSPPGRMPSMAELMGARSHWVLETQTRGLTGAWRPTPMPGELMCWVRGSGDPPPFQPFLTRDLQMPRGSATDPASASSALQELLYPQHGECLTHAPYVDDSSDPDGWTYGSSAARLATKRLGGRASNRVGDRYRQRLWRPLEAEEPEGSPPASPSRTSTRHLGAEPGQMDLERVQSSFWDAFKAVMSTRGISRIPMDPIAMLRRRSKDAERYEALAQRLPRWSDVDLLGELCVAALYSRAAYGFVARKGLFDSLVAGAQVFSLQKAVFDVSTDVDDATNKRAFLDMLGLCSDDLLHAQWKVEGTFCPIFAVARDDEMKWIVVAVRGSISTTDVLTDLAAKNVPFLEGTAHEGILATTERLVGELDVLLPGALEAHPGYRPVLCGHSMGGAVGALAAAMLRRRPWGAACVALGVGTPGAVSRNICDRLAREGAVTTVVNGRDWAPACSVSNVNELMDDLADLGLVKTLLRSASGLSNETREIKAPEELDLPPGDILQMVPSPQPGPAPKLLRAAPIDYHNAFPSFPDVEAHLPIRYVDHLLHGFADALDVRDRSPPQSLADFLAAVPEPAGAAAGSAPTPPAGAEGPAAEPGCARALRALRRVAAAQTARRASAHRQPNAAVEASLLPTEPDGARVAVVSRLGQHLGLTAREGL